jgi:hypothetical protein
LRHQSVKNRGDLSRKDYSDVLATRSKSKINKIKKQKEENDIREVKDCTFKPKLNIKPTFLRGNSNDSNSNRNSVFSGISGGGHQSQREMYVDNHLYKPKVRTDRSKEEIEFEKQKSECLFKPQQLSKKNYNNVAVSKIKLYIKTGQSPMVSRNSVRTSERPSTTKSQPTKELAHDIRPIILQMEVLISQGQVDYVILHKGDNVESIV